MSQKPLTKISLKNFFVYNVNYGDAEGKEEEKILYFYPNDTNIDVKMREVGLCEAVVRFTENFDPASCDAIHTQMTRKIFLQPEENFWIVMTINVPYGQISSNVMEGAEYLGSEVDTTVFKAVLKQAYSIARLFIGPFQTLLDSQNGDTKLLKKKLADFFKRYLLDLNLRNCDILNVFDGVQFLPLDKPTFLRCQCFINLVEASFPVVSHSILLYNDSLVWSGLGPDDVKVVFRYLTKSLLPSHSKNNTSSRSTRFVTEPDCLVDLVFADKSPKVYLGQIPEPSFFHLIVYKIADLILCLFLSAKEPLKLDFFRQIDAFSFEPMSHLVTEIKSYRRSTNNEQVEAPDIRFVYFNMTNLATKGTLRERRGNNSLEALARALVKLHIHNMELIEEGCLSSETCLRTTADQWVIARSSNFRQFYILIERKKLTLQEVDDIAKKVCDNQLKGIFFHV